MQRVLFRSATLLILVLLALPLQAMALDNIVLSNDTSARGLKGRTFKVLKQQIDQRLDGKVRVMLHHSGTLFDQKTQIPGLQLGGIDMIAPTSGIYTSLLPSLNIFSLPFLLSTPQAVRAAFHDPLIRSTFVPQLERQNIEPLAIWGNGARELSYQGPAIHTPDDMRGLKIRVQSIPVDLATMEALGAHAVSIAWSEVPTAMQQGVIGAVEPTPNALISTKLDELIDRVTRISYRYSFYIVSVNKRWWDHLSDDVRHAVQQSLDEATKWNWAQASRANQKAYAKLRQENRPVIGLTPTQRQAWIDRVQPVWRRFGYQQVDARVMQRLMSIAGLDSNNSAKQNAP